jgi:uncharacterized membrane protein YuzA (DUF378 family)
MRDDLNYEERAEKTIETMLDVAKDLFGQKAVATTTLLWYLLGRAAVYALLAIMQTLDVMLDEMRER